MQMGPKVHDGRFVPSSRRSSALENITWPIILPSSSITRSSSGMKSGLLRYWLSTKCSEQPGRYMFQKASRVRFSTSR